jgi:hypothetical protein
MFSSFSFFFFSKLLGNEVKNKMKQHYSGCRLKEKNLTLCIFKLNPFCNIHNNFTNLKVMKILLREIKKSANIFI